MCFKWSGLKVAYVICVAFVFIFLSFYLTFSCGFSLKNLDFIITLHISPFKEREKEKGIGREGVKDTVRSAD